MKPKAQGFCGKEVKPTAQGFCENELKPTKQWAVGSGRFADRIYTFTPSPQGVQVEQIDLRPDVGD